MQMLSHEAGLAYIWRTSMVNLSDSGLDLQLHMCYMKLHCQSLNRITEAGAAAQPAPADALWHYST